MKGNLSFFIVFENLVMIKIKLNMIYCNIQLNYFKFINFDEIMICF